MTLLGPSNDVTELVFDLRFDSREFCSSELFCIYIYVSSAHLMSNAIIELSFTNVIAMVL